MPKMYNPNYKGDLNVHDSRVETMKSKGWTLKPENKKESTKKKDSDNK